MQRFADSTQEAAFTALMKERDAVRALWAKVAGAKGAEYSKLAHQHQLAKARYAVKWNHYADTYLGGSSKMKVSPTMLAIVSKENAAN
jgi:hypothetical protein